MTYHWPPGDVYPRQHRASTAPAQSQPSFPRGPAIPPSLIPGYRHRQTISATGGVDRLLFSSGPDTSNHPMSIVSTTLVPVSDVALFSMTPSPYRDLQRPPPPVPVPVPPHQQPMVPPLPPKTPLKSPSSSPMLPPKPPSFIPAPLLPKPPRSKSQPPPPLPRGASPPFNAPPPPPMLPPKPLGARSSSVIVTPSHLPLLNTTPSVKSNANGSPNIDDATSLILPSLTSPAESSEGSPQMNEEEELELALKLSAHAEKEYAESLLSQDEALARALEESLLDSVASPFPPKLQPGLETADGKHVLSSSMAKPWDVHPYSPKQHYHLPLPARMDSSTSLALSDEAQFREDEALARKLEAEYESGRSTPTTQSNHVMDPNPPEYPHLPRYADIVDKDTAVQEIESEADARAPHVSPISTHAHERLAVSDQTNVPINVPPRQTSSPAQRTSPRPASLALSGTSHVEEESPGSSSPSSRASRAFATPNQYVEPALLYGVSFGFHSPSIDIIMMRDPLPNIIALPYGKCPPMHIQATSWRQLLKLMAKLSATQIEPSVEASAVTKGELNLRTVVQFFKVHHASSDWRTVIYLTIDYPPPPEHRYANGDVNVLPYSYNLSSLPTLLRDGPASQVSKYYTIPATSRTPLPKLPITMPSMAMYLASALEDSRRALNDTSSGVRRLAKMVDQFYPNEEDTAAAGEEEVRRRGGRALIGRLMGRASKPQRGRNADVYDLVTPFVPDEWG